MTAGLLILGALLMVHAYVHAASVIGRWVFVLSWWERHGAPIKWYSGTALIVAAAIVAIVQEATR